MKGITLCAECAYYDLKKHKCNRGATVDPDISKGQDVRFYVDCPLDDVEPVRHMQQYEKGFKDGMQAALKKIASFVKPRDPEICLLYAMQWKDDGCCMNCVECVKKHSE